MKTLDFGIDNVESYCAFFKSHGYVVIRDVLDGQEVCGTVNEIWDIIKESNANVDRNDPETWGDDFWPSKGGSHGFLEILNEYALKQTWENRQNPKIIDVFRNILGTNEILVKRDRFGLMRPTKNIQLKSGELLQRDEWKTKKSWLHWDQNPWRENDFCRVQGMILLTDHTNISGGFDCVPGFNHEWANWGIQNPCDSIEGASPNHGLIYVPPNDPIQNQVQHVLGRAGSLIIWDSRIPHQNYPNDDNTFRMVQYITFTDTKKIDYKKLQDTLCNQIKCGMIPKTFVQNLSELGRKVLGFQLYEGNNFDIEEITISKNAEESLRLLKVAQDHEQNGDFTNAAICFRKAYKLNPLLEETLLDDS